MSRQLQLLPGTTDVERGVERRLPLAALEFESPSAAIIATPLPGLARTINLVVFLLVVAMLIASGLIRIDKIVSAAGKLVAEEPNIVMQPFDRSIIESIEVRKGDIVRKGQVLARLNPTLTVADLTALKDQVDLFSARNARLSSQTAGGNFAPDGTNPHSKLQVSIFDQQTSEYNFSLHNFDQKIDQANTEIVGASSQAGHYRQRLEIAAAIEDMRKKLQVLNAGSLLNTLLATDARLNIAALLAQAESDAARASHKLAAAQAERETFVQHWNGRISEDLAETRRKLVQAQQDYSKASLLNQLAVLTAPQDGVVLSVAKISAGSVVTTAEALVQLVPLQTRLSVEADSSGINSGYVRPGDEVRIKFDTLPFLQYGSGRGMVRAISADSFSPETKPQEGGSTLPNRPRTLYYKGDISLDDVMLHDTPPGFRLMPGMPLTVDVKVGTRSVLAYFIAKILPVVSDSMHEP
ncbi:MAG: rane fusion protein hemolysin [Alphaproteobacteria bacterium]|nr:rane fusion protein hemolysin [Alphaproteobacteria bacterium]